MEELLKLFEENPDLGHRVEMMWTRGASAQEIADMLSGKGIAVEVAQIEELLSAMQAKRAEAIGASEKVDKDQLKAVAGGWCAFWQSKQGSGDSCSERFKYDYLQDANKCFGDQVCDDVFMSDPGHCMLDN